MDNIIKVTERNDTFVVDSRIIADSLDIQHKNLIETIRKHQNKIESDFGRVTFETLPFETTGGVQNINIAYLTEDQTLFIATLSRNTNRVIEFKSALVKAFQLARKQASPLQELSRKEILQLALKAEEEKEILLQQKLLLEKTAQQQAPKVIYYDEVLQSDSAHLTTLIAKELGMSAKTLNKELKQRKIIINVSGSWVLSAKYQNLEFTKTKTYTFTDANGKPQTSIQTLWTEKGRKFIHDLFKVKALTL